MAARVSWSAPPRQRRRLRGNGASPIVAADMRARQSLMPAPAPEPRRYGAVNWLGLWTLTLREVRRFLKVFTQTIVAPVVTTLLLLAVFALALGGSVREIAGLSFPEFLAPGLIIMAMVQNAFANTSSSLVIAKVQGNIVDSLMPPLSPGEILTGYVAGGVVRGLVCAAAVMAVVFPWAGIWPAHPPPPHGFPSAPGSG